MTQKKKSPVIFKGSTKSAITLHSMHVFSVQQTAMCVYGSTEDHMCDEMLNCFNRIFFTSIEMKMS